MGEIQVKLRKGMIFTVIRFKRSIRHHPFLVGMLCLLVLLYRSFPFLFSILISISPILVCTAILLGTLLSFGQTNIPEFDKEERTTHEIVSLRSGFSGDNVVHESNESCSVEIFSDKERDEVEKSTEITSLVVDGISSEVSSTERSREIRFNDMVRSENHETLDQDNEFKVRLGVKKTFENQYSLITEADDENLELENDRSPVGSIDSKAVNVDSLDSPPGSPWKHADEEDEDDDEEEDEDEVEDDTEAVDDSGSDRAESSSPDASMADIIPMLDELHPLLDENALQPLNASRVGSGSEASSESSISSESSNESSDSETQEEFEPGENGNEEEETELTKGENEDGERSAITWTEEDQRNFMEMGSSELERNQRLENLILRRKAEGNTHSDDDEKEEDQLKSPITWTEEDQRNLMELGSSEIERNLRLEKLIARRRARKTITEKNLIDLDTIDPPFNLPSISTTRTNPFDFPNESYEHMGLPPIPGSAPSILLPWRNPFDLPYDSSEEKPDLMEDSFQQEFMPTHHQAKDQFFRRHESFNVRPSPFGFNRTEKHDVRLRPYFVPERIPSEGPSFFPFNRQSSEVSEGKISSVPDTESVGSELDSDVEEAIKNRTEEEVTHEPESEIEVKNRDIDISQDPRIISMVVEEITSHIHNQTQEDVTHESELIEENVNVNEDLSVEPGVISMIENAPENIGHGSESSDDEDSIESDDKRHDEADELLNSTQIHSIKERNIGETSSPLKSESSEQMYTDTEAEDLPLPSFADGKDRYTVITTQRSIEIPHKEEPVYDLSPKNELSRSSSGSSSDQYVESEMVLPNIVVRRSVSFADKVLELRSPDMFDDDVFKTPHDKDTSSQVYPIDDGEYEINEDDDIIPVNTVEENVMHEDVTRSLDIETHGVVPEIEPVESLNRALNDQDLAELEKERNLETLEPVLSVVSEQEIIESISDSVHHEESEIQSSSNHQDSVLLSTEELAQSDKSVDPPLTQDHADELEPSYVEEHVEDVMNAHYSNITEIREQFDELSQDKDNSTSLESIEDPSEEYNIQSPPDEEEINVNDEVDDELLSADEEIKSVEEIDDEMLSADEGSNGIGEIDEELLSELDAVGDFRVNQVREVEDHVEFSGPISSGPTEKPSSPITESNNSDEDIKLVSEIEGSGESTVENIDTTQYEERVVETDDLEPIKENLKEEIEEADVASTNIVEHKTDSSVEEADVASNILEQQRVVEVDNDDFEPTIETSKEEEEADVASNIVERKTDSSEIHYNMPEKEVRAVEDTDSVSEEKIESILQNPGSSLEESSEDIKADEVSSQSKVNTETNPEPSLEDHLEENEDDRVPSQLKVNTDTDPEPLLEEHLEENEADKIPSQLKVNAETDPEPSLEEHSEENEADKIPIQLKVNTETDPEPSLEEHSEENEADKVPSQLKVNTETDPEPSSEDHPEENEADTVLGQLKVNTETHPETLLEDRSEDNETDKVPSQSNVNTESPKEIFEDFDQIPEENTEKIPIFDSDTISLVSENKEETSQKLGVLNRAYSDVYYMAMEQPLESDSNLALNKALESSEEDVFESSPQTDSDLALKKVSESSEEELFEISENGSGSGSSKEVLNQVDTSEEVKSDFKETTEKAPEKPDYEENSSKISSS